MVVLAAAHPAVKAAAVRVAMLATVVMAAVAPEVSALPVLVAVAVVAGLALQMVQVHFKAVAVV
jgi:hypothetical protein